VPFRQCSMFIFRIFTLILHDITGVDSTLYVILYPSVSLPSLLYCPPELPEILQCKIKPTWNCLCSISLRKWTKAIICNLFEFHWRIFYSWQFEFLVATLMAEIRKPRFGAGIPNRVASLDGVPHKTDMQHFVAYPPCNDEVCFLTRYNNKQ
jgi:hypothetical protein